MSIRPEKCSFCATGNIGPENTTHCQCVEVGTQEGNYQLRPWQDLDGQISTHVFGVFLTPIFDAIYHSPGICEEGKGFIDLFALSKIFLCRFVKTMKELTSKFDHMCARVTLVELLRILESQELITHERIKYSEESPVPFTDNSKEIIIIAYQALPNALERVTALLGHLAVE